MYPVPQYAMMGGGKELGKMNSTNLSLSSVPVRVDDQRHAPAALPSGKGLDGPQSRLCTA
jgi:hypothetical protein